MIPRTAALAAAVCAAILLAGCSAAAPPPPGLTQAQLDAMVQKQSDAAWESLGLSSAIPKPDVHVITYTTGANFSERQVECLQALGLNAREVSGGFTVDGVGNSDAYLVSTWTCRTEYPADVRASGYLTDDQVLYMYDYWSDRVAPCLKLLGFDLSPTPPRSQFLDDVRSGSYWTPYRTVEGLPLVELPDQWHRIDLQCHPLPDGYWAYEPLAYLHALNQEGTGGLG